MFPKKIDKLSFTTRVGGVLVLGWMVTTHMIYPQDCRPTTKRLQHEVPQG
jgi:hypothetical protein